MRSTIVVALAGAAWLLGGCGPLDSGSDDDFAKYSAADVKKRFNEVTGARLVSSSVRSSGLDILRVQPSNDRGAYERFGSVSVLVTGDEDRRDNATQRTTGLNKVIDNVVVQSGGTDDRARQGFRRMVGVLSSLGKPASAAKLAPEDTPCDKAGIDPEGGDGKAGSCVAEDQKTVKVVNADGRLELPGKTISGLRVGTGQTLTQREFGSTERDTSSGRYVIVSVQIENTGDEPLTSLRPGLVIDGKRYSEDVQSDVRLRDREPFPIQPGGRGRSITVFDVPGPAGQEALSEGAVEFPAGQEGYSSIEASTTTGRIRLDGARGLGSRIAGTRLTR